VTRVGVLALPGSDGTVSFKYDPAGRRIQKVFTQGSTSTTSNYVYDGKGPNLIEEVDNGGNAIARYVYSKAVDEPLAQLRSGATNYYEADGLASVTSLSNTAGALAQTYTFDSFGNLTASTGSLTNRFQYTGREFDPETNLYFYRRVAHASRHLEPSWVAYPLPFKRVGRSSLSFAADFNSSDPSAVVLRRDNSHTNCSMANPRDVAPTLLGPDCRACTEVFPSSSRGYAR
jgi:hypothetical protein